MHRKCLTMKEGASLARRRQRQRLDMDEMDRFMDITNFGPHETFTFTSPADRLVFIESMVQMDKAAQLAKYGRRPRHGGQATLKYGTINQRGPSGKRQFLLAVETHRVGN